MSITQTPEDATAPPTDRRPGKLDGRSRAAVADRLAMVVAESARLRARGLPAGTTREQVLAARGRLLDLEHLLRSGVPIPRAAERRVMTILDRIDGGAYAAAGPRDLHDDAEGACGAAGSVTPFH